MQQNPAQRPAPQGQRQPQRPPTRRTAPPRARRVNDKIMPTLPRGALLGIIGAVAFVVFGTFFAFVA